MTALRAAVPGIEFSWCASNAGDVAYKFDTDTLLANRVLDTATIMEYNSPFETISSYLTTLNMPENRVLIGVGFQESLSCVSDIKYRWIHHINEGYRNWAFFCWANNIDDDAGQQAAIDDYLAGTLSVTQAPITTVSVTPGTSFTLVVDGVTQTTNYADVTDHLYYGYLKTHVEAAIGGTNPAVIYYRWDSTTTRILVGGHIEP